MGTEAIIRVDNLSKSFGKIPILKNISFEVLPGEVISIIGPSGSGKSTLLRTLNALEPIQEGRIKVAGFDYETIGNDIVLARRKTAMIFQRFELFPHKTVLENITLPLRKVLKKSKFEANEKARNLLEKVGLLDQEKKYPKQLSGGQQQRVAIARALALEPQILLCDEPTSALDPELVHEVVTLLTQIAKQGMTMIIVTHEISFAKKISNKTFFLDRGELVEKGLTSRLFASPETERLKNFLSRIEK